MNVWLFLSLMCGLLIVLVLVLFWHPQFSRTKTDRGRTDAVFRDDDRYWYGGFFVFYYSLKTGQAQVRHILEQAPR